MKRKLGLLNTINLHSDYLAVFGTEPGKRVLNHICKVGYISKPTVVPGNHDMTLVNEGMRRMALSILKFVNVDHANIVEQIEKEYRDEI